MALVMNFFSEDINNIILASKLLIIMDITKSCLLKV